MFCYLNNKIIATTRTIRVPIQSKKPNFICGRTKVNIKDAISKIPKLFELVNDIVYSIE